MTPPQPVTVSIDVPQPRTAVYDHLDVMANHEAFTDHMLTNWRVSGPATGIGSKAHVTTKAGGMTDEAVIEVFEIDPGRMIRERSIGAKGKRIAHGTYPRRLFGRRCPPATRAAGQPSIVISMWCLPATKAEGLTSETWHGGACSSGRSCGRCAPATCWAGGRR